MIVEYFLSAIVLGVVVAIPPGAVTIIACQRALFYGFKNSLVFSLGSRLADTVYVTLVYIGVANVLSRNQQIKTALWIVCGLLLILQGIFSLRSFKNGAENNNQTRLFQTNPWATFLSGIVITLTNPTTIIGWIAIAGNYFLIWNNKFAAADDYAVITIFLIIAGVMLWFVALTYIVSKFKKLVGPRLKSWLLILSNAFLILFGCAALYYASDILIH
jgi:threonine/homoserine/homoserine lactone efflux protein